MNLGIGLGLGSNAAAGVALSAVTYRLIDGAFLEKLLRQYSTCLNIDLLSRIRWPALSSGAHRTIFYDALPVRKSSQSKEDFEAVEERKIVFLNKLRAIPNVHVRDGITRLRTKSKGRAIGEVLEQKGVDTWIAVDAMHHALTGLADMLEIFTSDSDLYPVFEALQNTRCRGVLRYQHSRAPQELIYAADIATPITSNEILGWCGMYNGAGVNLHKYPFHGGHIRGFKHAGKLFEIVSGLGDQYGCNYYDEYGNFQLALEAPYLVQFYEWIIENGGTVKLEDLKQP